jgi:hypothetical protein
MSEWIRKNAHYIQLGEWTITKAQNVPKPYSLWNGIKNHGHFETLEAAKNKYTELMG